METEPAASPAEGVTATCSRITVHKWLQGELAAKRRRAGTDFGPRLAHSQPIRPDQDRYTIPITTDGPIEVYGVLWRDGVAVRYLDPSQCMPGDTYSAIFSPR